MYYVYILKSLRINRYYVGHCKDMVKRLEQHNKGYNKSTKPYIPYELVFSEEYLSKSDAFKREQQIKSYRHGQAFRKLISF